MKLRNFMVVNEVVMILLPIVIISLVVLQIINQSFRDEVLNKNDMITHVMAQHVADLLDVPMRELEHTRNVLVYSNIVQDTDVNEYLDSVLKSYPSFDGIEIVDSSGVVKNVAPFNLSSVGLNRMDENFHQEVKNDASYYWSTSFVSAQTGRPTVVVALPMNDKYLLGYLNLESISNISSVFHSAFGQDIAMVITDDKGVFISHHNIGSVFQRRYEDNFNLIKILEQRPEKSYELEYNGVKMLASYKKIVEPNWHIVVYRTYDSAFAAVNKIKILVILTAIFAIIGAIIVSRYKTGRIINSLEKLKIQVEKIAGGDYKTVVATGKFDELDQLAASVNKMAHSILGRDKKLQHMANTDYLTELPNKSYFKEQLIDFSQTTGCGFKFAIGFIDIDNFKFINDTYGHWFGDAVLKAVSARLRLHLDNGDLLARFGGDEFVFALCDFGNEETLCELLTGIMREFKRPFQIGGYSMFHEVSIGVAIYPDDDSDVDELLKYADMAMYYAKAHGKNKYQFYNSEMHSVLQRELQIKQALRKAQEQNEFAIHYQPIVAIADETVRGFEALLRWNSNELGNIAPLEFIGLAEETGLINEIGKWVMETACKKAVELQEIYQQEFVISVNISAVQLKEGNFKKVVAEVLAESGINPHQLELEVTESVFIDSLKETIEILNEIKALGVRISLDDFGTGYSSLAYLRNLPIDTIKIDRAFMRDFAHNRKSQDLFEAIIVLAKKLKLSVVAEGIENDQQYSRLMECDCEYAQGYFIKKPMHINEVKQYCETRIKERKKTQDTNLPEEG